MLSVLVAEFFRETVPPILAIFQSSICLSFFWQRVFGEELCFRGWGICQENFSLKMPGFSPKNPAVKVLSILAFDFRAPLFLG